jgi:hypothetical protein
MGKYGEENVNVEPTINPKKKTLCGWWKGRTYLMAGVGGVPWHSQRQW